MDAPHTTRRRASITGIGLLTPLGLTAAETWTSLLAGGCISTHAPIPLLTSRSRVSELAILAARQALIQSGWTADDLASDDIALVVGTSKGPIESWMTPPPRPAGGRNSFGLAEMTTDIAADLHLGTGPRLTVSAACATGIHALIRATMLIESGLVSRVLVVAAESSLGPLFTGSFQRLGVLARDACRPFDTHRTGFLMSEAAAAICLEQPANSSKIHIENYALGADATHLTGGDRDGVTLRHLLRTVLDSRPTDFVHAHGTGTIINDATELAALESTLPGPCPLYSHKGAIGHSLGAAGLTAVVLNCLIHSTATVPPNIRTHSPLPTRLIQIKDDIVHLPNIRRSIVLAAGFGGSAGVMSLVS
ncbi:MAG TPA: beta-ketoacyl synthase N-terminal-like domain-containing protein [Tepidisphaeraceae bacterium]|jgi:3-oxoacyl-[acyl-carrier-protein] synthase II|nr:beta-ketoacyl synthase N-terminal-like domain-containing protein [Tepidisphaeraceae bacterium]